MKKRILTLALALILLISAVTVPVSAAAGKDVHKYLKEIAMEGYHDTEDNCYYDGFYLDSEAGLIYAVYYWEKDQYVETTIFCDDYEVTWRISSNPSPAYNVYVMWYQGEQFPKGTVSLAANYNGEAYTSFKKFEGDASYKSDMLAILNQWLPVILEFTRAVINEKDYRLADLGLTGYNKCDYIHAFDKGTITRQPTCVSQGIKIYTCRVCGATNTEYIAATGVHTWDKGTVITEPTCTQSGVKRYTCMVCKTATKDEEIPALGHAWAFDHMVDSGTGHDGNALYVCTRCSAAKTGRLCAAEVFTDMPKEGNWAHDPIDWAYFNGITSGKAPTKFKPRDVVTRGEAMTFLWKTMGGLEPSTEENPFKDVKSSRFFYKPVLWAVENQITDGMTPNTFAPMQKCTRAQIVTFLPGLKVVGLVPSVTPLSTAQRTGL